MKIYVIRHGKTEFNKQGIINGYLDDPLAPEGFEQARQAQATLPSTIKRIYSSSLERARQTADILNEVLGAELTFHDELKEVNFGDLNGTPFLDEHKQRHAQLDYDWRPSGENFDEVKQRTLKILNEIKNNNHDDGEVLIVGHGGTVRTLHKLQFDETRGGTENAQVYEFNLDEILNNHR